MSKVKYLSQEWAQEVKANLLEKLPTEKMNGITSSMTNVYKDCPDGVEMHFHVAFVDGVVSEVLTGEGKGPKAEFMITGTYEVFKQISTAELSAQRALMGGMLKLKGNMVKALKLASLVDRINKVIATIPTEF